MSCVEKLELIRDMFLIKADENRLYLQLHYLHANFSAGKNNEVLLGVMEG
jgi:hypothetical protein